MEALKSALEVKRVDLLKILVKITTISHILPQVGIIVIKSSTLHV